MHSVFRSICAPVLCVCFALVLSGDAAAKSRDPIKVGIGTQTRQQIIAHIAGRALKRAGFKVEFVKLDRSAGIEMIASGKAYFNPNFAVGASAADLEQAISENRIRSPGGLERNGEDEPGQKIAWSGMGNQWPYAEKMLKTLVFGADELDALAKVVDDGGRTPDQAVSDWMKNNKPVWKRWTAASTNWMKP